jgi:hypothetical protein
VFLLPLLALALAGFVLTSAGRDSGRVSIGAPYQSARHALPGPAAGRVPFGPPEFRGMWSPPSYASPQCPPSPMAMLNGLLAAQQEPPPFVVQCAIAEAELSGRYDVAYALTQQYVIPALAQQGGGTPAVPPAAPAPSQAPAAVPSPMVDAAPAPDQGDAEQGGGPTGPDVGPPPAVPSPISGVSDAQWSHVLGALVRESPTLASPKHVGRYRHNAARIAALGLEPNLLAGSPELQDMAMSTDLADCFGHLHRSGSLDAYVGKAIVVPGCEGQVPASLSGVLGVCSVAGLERAISWLDNPDDRAAYPHTTMAFVRTNGVF